MVSENSETFVCQTEHVPEELIQGWALHGYRVYDVLPIEEYGIGLLESHMTDCLQCRCLLEIERMLVTPLNPDATEGNDPWNLMIQKRIPLDISRHEPTEYHRKIFPLLVERVKRDTCFSSLTMDKCVHPAHLRIIGMGISALPLILKEYEDSPWWWNWALRAITGEKPDRFSQTLEQSRECWLQWGRENGYMK